MSKIIQKPLIAVIFLLLTLSLGACQTTREERIMIGTIGGAAVGTGVVIASGGSVVPAIVGGGLLGGTIGLFSE